MFNRKHQWKRYCRTVTFPHLTQTASDSYYVQRGSTNTGFDCPPDHKMPKGKRLVVDYLQKWLLIFLFLQQSSQI